MNMFEVKATLHCVALTSHECYAKGHFTVSLWLHMYVFHVFSFKAVTDALAEPDAVAKLWCRIGARRDVLSIVLVLVGVRHWVMVMGQTLAIVLVVVVKT